MSILSKLRTLPDFPLLNKDAMESLKNSLNKDIARIQSIPKARRLPEEISLESALKKERELYDELLLLLKIQTPQSAYELLAECSIINLDDATAHELISYWQGRFNTTLEHEPSPLSLSVLFADKAANPILFTALIHSLMYKGITADDLLESGLLHNYVTTHISNLDDITAVYSLLKQSKSLSNHEEITRLCDRVKEISVPDVTRIYSTLAGSIVNHAQYAELNNISVHPLNNQITLTSENLTRMQEFFAEEFLVFILSLPTSPVITTWISAAIQKMTIAEAGKCYKYILNSVDEEHRFAMLEQFSAYLSGGQALELVQSQQVSLWIVVSIKLELLKELDEASLDALVENSPITIGNMSYALQCLGRPELQAYKDNIHLIALQCLLQNPTVEVPYSVLRSFKQHPQASRWCKDFNDQILANFNQEILVNITKIPITPLTEHSYINITDSYNNKLPQWRLLEKLSPLPLHYPHDIYGAQGCIMKALLDKEILTPECLDIFHPAYKYETYKEESESYRIAAKERSLLTCLAEQNDEALQEWIIQTISESPYNKSNLQSCVINDVPIIDIALACENATFIKRYYSLFPADITKKDNDGNTVLHNAVPYPELLKAILELLPENARFAAVQEKDKYGNTVLHKAAPYPESIKAILELLPANERLAAVKAKDIHDNTVLHKAAPYPESIKVILELYPANERLSAVKAKDRDRNNVLHEAAPYPESIKVILELYTANGRLLAVQAEDRYGDTVLHKAALYPESLKAILELYPANGRLSAVQEKGTHGNNVLHEAAPYPESLNAILELLPENKRLAAMQGKGHAGDTVLHNAAVNPESLKVILELYPANERLVAVKEKNNHGNAVLHKAAPYPESIKVILELYPANERLAAVQEKDNDGSALLRHAVPCHESLKAILELLPANERLVVVKEKNNHGNTVLSHALPYPESIKVILELYPANERLSAVKAKDRYGNTVLHKAAPYPESIKVILELYPENERLAALQEQDKYGDTVLHNAAVNPELLKAILELLPENERLAAAQVKDKDGHTVLRKAVHSPELLKAILELLPENERLAAVQEKDNYGDTVLHRAVHSPESLKAILELLPEDARLAAVQEKDNYGDTLLHIAVHSPESLQAILALLPENARFIAVQEKNKYGDTVLHKAAPYPESMKVILELLPKNSGRSSQNRQLTGGSGFFNRQSGVTPQEDGTNNIPHNTPDLGL
jgi:ankyrin repeat protein